MNTSDSAPPVKRKAGRPRKTDKEAANALAGGGLSLPSPAASTSGTGAGRGGGRGRAARIAAEERQAAQLAASDESGAEEQPQQSRQRQLQQQQQSRAGSADEPQQRGTKRSAPDNAQTAGTSGTTGQRVRGERQKFNRKDLFEKDLKTMMYAFGDDPDPLPESVAVLEEIMVDYLTDLCRAASIHSPNAKKLRLDDLRFALRKPQQRRQLARVEELLYAQEDIARARKNLDINSFGKDVERGAY